MVTKSEFQHDFEIIQSMLNKYSNNVIWEGQEGQLEHFDNQLKLAKIIFLDIRAGLFHLQEAFRMGTQEDVIRFKPEEFKDIQSLADVNIGDFIRCKQCIDLVGRVTSMDRDYIHYKSEMDGLDQPIHNSNITHFQIRSN